MSLSNAFPVQQISPRRIGGRLIAFAICVMAQCLAGQLAFAGETPYDEIAVEADRWLCDATGDSLDSRDGGDDLPHLSCLIDPRIAFAASDPVARALKAAVLTESLQFRVPAARAPPRAA